MIYTLITAKGKTHTFRVRAVAEMYQQAYGGCVTAARDTEKSAA